MSGYYLHGKGNSTELDSNYNARGHAGCFLGLLWEEGHSSSSSPFHFNFVLYAMPVSPREGFIRALLAVVSRTTVDLLPK